MLVSCSPRSRWLRSPLRLPTGLLLAGTALLLLQACHRSSRGGAAVKPATVNLTATAVQVASTAPRVGFPLELVTTIQTNETAPDVTVSFWAQNVDDVAAQKEQVRQFYLGSTTFPQVTPDVTDYRSTIEVPTSLDPAGTYVLLAAVDPQSLITETKEDDNTAEVAATLQPLADPNLVLRAGTLDQQSLLLDPALTDIGEQNADLGASLSIGVEGTLSPTPVEVFVKLRIRRLDRPAGADVHDVPLYLWDSAQQRYADAYGLQGPVQWLTLGDVVPLAATESDTALDIAEHGANSSHLDLYLPGRLAEVMITILEQLVGAPPGPPPDLPDAAIQALEQFFSAARLSMLRYGIVVDVRSKDPAFVDTNPDDNSLELPLYVVLPGQESFAPDRPLAFEKGATDRWGSDKFGVGYGFDALASLDGRGAIASVAGVLDAEVFGNRFDFLTVDGRAQVVPAVDPSAVEGEDSSFGIDVRFLGFTVYSLHRPLGFSTSAPFSVSKEKKYSRTFFLGPIPVTASGGVAGEIGYELVASVQPLSMVSRIEPYAKLEGTLEAGVGIPGLRAGAGGTLTLIEERFGGNAEASLLVQSVTPAVFQGQVTMQVENTLTGPSGRLFLFVEYPGIKWCRGCIFGFCFPFPCGFKTCRNEWGLVTWTSFVKNDVLFQATLCKRVVIDGTGVHFTLCQ